MIKYSFEQKKALVTAYLNGEGGIRTVIKKYGYSQKKVPDPNGVKLRKRH